MENDLTIAETADRLNASPKTVYMWCQQGLFPNARQLPVKIGKGNAWLIPEKDVENFQPPTRGRKPSNNPSKAALAKRRQREQETKTN